jgi:hypothetical protein
MNNAATKIYDHAADTVHDWVETVRDELPDIKDVKKDVRDVAGDVTDRAGELWEDTADRVLALMPGAAARAATSRRRRWMWGGLAVAGLALLFGPGGAKRRAAIKSRISRQTKDGASAHPAGSPPIPGS